MDDKELKDRLSELKKQIKTNSKDARWSDKLVDELLSVKGQLDVEPVDDWVNEIKVDYRHNYGTMEVMNGSSRNMPVCVFASKGFRLISRGDSLKSSGGANSLHEWLTMLCYYQRKKDAGETLSKDESDVLDALIFTSDNICQIPLFGFYDDTFKMELLKVLHSNLSRITEPLLNSELKDEEGGALEDMIDREKLKSSL